MNNEQKRVIFFDYLRVFSIFAMIVLHVVASYWYEVSVDGFQWQILHFFNAIVRWCVPVFVMISGALFLSKDNTIKYIYSKHIFRMVIAFFIWSAIYCGFYHSGWNTSIEFVVKLLQGHYHMWFILMIIGVYMCVPFVRSITSDDKRTKYFLLLSFIFCFLIPTLKLLSADFFVGAVPKIMSALIDEVNKMKINMVLGYTGYFILGYYLFKTDLSLKQRKLVYILGILGFLLTILVNDVVALKTQRASSSYFANFSINILLESIVVFVWFKYRNFKNTKWNNTIVKLSAYSFGAYLVHVLVLDKLLNGYIGLNTLSFNPLLSVPCIAVITFIGSYIISGALHKIPRVKKYMV